MNKEQQKLKLQMFVFAIFIFVSFGIIIIKEKSSTILIPKVEEKMNTYLNEKYNENELNKSKVTYKTPKYIMKVSDNNNKYHYFYLFKKKLIIKLTIIIK